MMAPWHREMPVKNRVNFGEALTELNSARRVIPTEATQGIGGVEPLETRSVTPKNNPTHERPASQDSKRTGHPPN